MVKEAVRKLKPELYTSQRRPTGRDVSTFAAGAAAANVALWIASLFGLEVPAEVAANLALLVGFVSARIFKP